MPRGVKRKPDMLKVNEVPRPGFHTQDDISPVDKGHDFVKPGETAQIGRNN